MLKLGANVMQFTKIHRIVCEKCPICLALRSGNRFHGLASSSLHHRKNASSSSILIKILRFSEWIEVKWQKCVLLDFWSSENKRVVCHTCAPETSTHLNSQLWRSTVNNSSTSNQIPWGFNHLLRPVSRFFQLHNAVWIQNFKHEMLHQSLVDSMGSSMLYVIFGMLPMPVSLTTRIIACLIISSRGSL